MQTPPKSEYVPDSQVLANQAKAKAMGIDIPGLATPTPGSAASITPTGFSYTKTPDEIAADTARANLLKINNADANTSINGNQAYKEALSRYQAQIDATNSVYNDMLNKARIEGQGRLGNARAGDARNGTLGSDFGNAHTNTVQDANTAVEGSIQNERSAKINEILGLARKDANDALTAKTAAKKAGAEALVKYYTEDAPAQRNSRVSKIASALYSKSIDPSTLSKDELTALTTEWGVNANDISTAYKTLKNTNDTADLAKRKTEADIAKINADVASGKLLKIGEGDLLYNTETGEMIKNPKTAGAGQGLLDASRKLSMTRTEQLIENSKALEASRIIGSQIKTDGRIKNFSNISAPYGRVQAAEQDIKDNGINPANAGDLIEAVTQLNSGGGQITEGKLDLIRQSQSYQSELATMKQKIDGEGGAVSKKTADQMIELSNKIRNIYEKEYKTATAQYNGRLKSVNGQDLTAYSPLTDITQLPAVVDGSYDHALSGATTGDAPAVDESTGDPDYDAYLKAIGNG